MVFQNYAIFPNLTVAGNVAYGLKARKVAGAEIAERVADALALVRLQGYGERWPHQLSGGQLQRVAIARALVIRPEVLLLDEPLSNLDARLRVDMRGEIRELQQRLKITTVYVTHDQEEALAVSDRIAVMQAGRIEQLGGPGGHLSPAREPVRRPVHGHDQCACRASSGLAHGRDRRVCGSAPPSCSLPGSTRAKARAVSLCLRPEALRIVGPGEAAPRRPARIEATVRKAEFIGALGAAGGRACGRHAAQGRRARRSERERCAGQPHRLGLRSGLRDGLPAGQAMSGLRVAPLARLPLAIGAMAFLFLGLFLLYPLWGVLSASVLTPDGATFTLDNYVKVLSRSFYRASVTNTLTIGLLATVTTTLMAVPLAFAIARLDIPGKLLLIGLAALPLVLPSFVGAYALLLLLGRSGIVTQALNAWGIPFGSIYGTPGIVTVYTLTLYPYVLLPTVAGLKAIDLSVEEAAQNLGSSLARTFRTVTLPIVIPSVLSGALLVFIETIENFGVPAVLAEDKPILAVEAYKLFIGETATNPSAAGVLGVLLIAVDGHGADHPAALSGEPALRHRRPRRAAVDQDRHRLAHAWRPPIAGPWCCWPWCRSLPSSCCRSWNFAGRCCMPPSASGTMPSFSPPPAGRSPTRCCSQPWPPPPPR